MPQVDKFGKAHVWRTMEALSAGEVGASWGSASAHWLDLTDGTRLTWWLWICNLGPSTTDAIGVGVREAHVTMKSEHEAIFEFTRTDHTKCMVRLFCHQGSSARRLRMYVSASNFPAARFGRHAPVAH